MVALWIAASYPWGIMRDRFAAHKLLVALKDTPVVYLQGPRQAGKSTLTQAIAQRHRFAHCLTLDDATVAAAAESDPVGFVRGLSGPTVIDEVQRVPKLSLAIKAEVDAHRRPGRFLLTGSASVMSLPRLADSLAGRMELHTLWPFSQGELLGRQEAFVDRLFAAKFSPSAAQAHDEPWLLERLCAGGYPEAVARKTEARRRAWFDSYVSAILQRDLRDLANIDRLADVPQLLSLLAARAAELTNLADLARSLAMPVTTVRRYVALLEHTFLAISVNAWHRNLGKRLVKAPKTYLVDTGLLLHLIDTNAARLKRDRRTLGHVLENFVAMELLKQLGWAKRRCGLYHFRTEAGREVDLVLEDGAGRLVGIEVKASATVDKHDLAGLKALAELTGDRFVRGVVLYTGSDVVPFGKTLYALPLAQLWDPGSRQ